MAAQEKVISGFLSHTVERNLDLAGKSHLKFIYFFNIFQGVTYPAKIKSHFEFYTHI